VTESRLLIDLDALAHNHAVLGATAGAEVLPVAKADGYGLGAVPVARRLAAEGARTFYVARISEGETLRAALPGVTILVLDGAPPGSAARLVAAALTPVLNSSEQVAYWAAEGQGAPAALQVDTGMNRLGLAPEQASALAAQPPSSLRLVHLLSHLACADDPDSPMNARQLAAFREVRDLFPDLSASFANSAGVFLGPDYAFDGVRPGISLYGGGPNGRPHPRLRAVATLEAAILQVRDVRPGETVGYGATFTADRPLRAAILAAGYADGLLRAGSNRGFGVLDGRRAPILGRISMDLIAVDVSDTPAQAGDRIQLLGPDAPIDEVAEAAGAIAYEFLVRLSPRLQRTYLGARG
jgi:alanine racemase